MYLLKLTILLSFYLNYSFGQFTFLNLPKLNRQNLNKQPKINSPNTITWIQVGGPKGIITIYR